MATGKCVCLYTSSFPPTASEQAREKVEFQQGLRSLQERERSKPSHCTWEEPAQPCSFSPPPGSLLRVQAGQEGSRTEHGSGITVTTSGDSDENMDSSSELDTS